MLQTIMLCAGTAKIKLRSFFSDEKGDVNIVSIVVLIGIAVLLAIVFRGQIEKLLTSLFETITGSATKAVSGGSGGGE